jgi:protein-tyrosine phosphatase
LAALKIRTVCDFRSKAERDREPTQWQGVAPEFLLLEIGGGQHGNRDPAVTFMRPILEGKATPAQVENMMRDTTAQMPLVDGKQYAPMLRRLTASSEPLLYHCTAGKDRTGLATAFLMKILGVKPDQIEADYLLVNKLMPAEAMAPAMAKRMEAMAGGPVDPVLIQPLMGTKAEWLRAAFAAIDEKYGSFDAFRRDVLQITSEDAAVLRLRLLE